MLLLLQLNRMKDIHIYILELFLSRSNASQTFKDDGPVACQVITTSLPSLLQDTITGCQRYQPGPAQLFPTLCETFAAVVGACTLSLSLSQLDRWELYCVLVICRERARQTIFTEQSYFRLWQACLHLAAITHLHLVKSVMLFKSIMSTDCHDWYWREGK